MDIILLILALILAFVLGGLVATWLYSLATLEQLRAKAADK